METPRVVVHSTIHHVFKQAIKAFCTVHFVPFCNEQSEIKRGACNETYESLLFQFPDV